MKWPGIVLLAAGVIAGGAGVAAFQDQDDGGSSSIDVVGLAASAEPAECSMKGSLPDQGRIELQFLRPSSENLDRNDYRMSGTVIWDSQAAIDCFDAGFKDWGYEHEIVYQQWFDRKIWNEHLNFGEAEPYLDTTASDPGGKTLHSFGLFRPERLQVGIAYSFDFELVLPNAPDGKHHFLISGEVVEKNCSRSGPWCVGLPGSLRDAPDYPYVGTGRDWSVTGHTCFDWVQGSNTVADCSRRSAPTTTTTTPRRPAPTTSSPKPPAPAPSLEVQANPSSCREDQCGLVLLPVTGITPGARVTWTIAHPGGLVQDGEPWTEATGSEEASVDFRGYTPTPGTYIFSFTDTSTGQSATATLKVTKKPSPTTTAAPPTTRPQTTSAAPSPPTNSPPPSTTTSPPPTRTTAPPPPPPTTQPPEVVAANLAIYPTLSSVTVRQSATMNSTALRTITKPDTVPVVCWVAGQDVHPPLGLPGSNPYWYRIKGGGYVTDSGLSTSGIPHTGVPKC